MIAGLEIPTSGEILLDEEDVTFLQLLKGTSLLWSVVCLYPHMNVWKNLLFH